MDPVLELAEEIFIDYEQAALKREVHYQDAALVGLGFENWLCDGEAYLDVDTLRRRQKIIFALSNKSYGGKLFQLGLPHPKRNVERKIAFLKPYLKIDSAGKIQWGLLNTKRREIQFRRQYDYLELSVKDNREDIITPIQSEKFTNETSLNELDLNDDDYRFNILCRNHNWGRSGWSFDMAIVNNQWKRLNYQGHDWDGEYEGFEIRQNKADLKQKEVELKNSGKKKQTFVVKLKANPTLVKTALKYYNGDKFKFDGGINWFRVLLAFGEKPNWAKKSLPEPTTKFTSKEAFIECRIWSGWFSFAKELKRLEDHNG